MSADLVVDASGQGTLTLALLRAAGLAQPDETTVGVDVGYASAIFAIPDDAPKDWKGVFTFPSALHGSRGALLLPLEGNRWILTVAGRHAEKAPGGPRRIHGLRAPAAHADDLQRHRAGRTRERSGQGPVSGERVPALRAARPTFPEGSFPLAMRCAASIRCTGKA